ncbi:hypothetical protein ACFYXS_24780 [Streptomyces sp. NPDC002574]|uniref:hypothetical protein n=1 Tax=Streptomyces sp. NPDC002574 TaxID=3364652 RepID=UPI0036738FE0
MTQATMSSGRGHEQDNPFAPPPEDAPDQPWQPRRPQQPSDEQDSDQRPTPPPPPAWGSQWSDRQPGRGGGLGDRPGGDGGYGGRRPDGPRFDPTDPAQRRARYALLCGMWGLFFALLLGWTYLALLLGGLALYWGVNALRMKPEERAKARAEAAALLADGPAAPPPPPADPNAKPQRPAAVSGIVMGALAVGLVAGLLSSEYAYRDYYACVGDALTQSARDSCAHDMPAPPVWLRKA